MSLHEPRPHNNSTDIIARLARTFRVDVEAVDKDRWSAAITLAKALDTLVDDDHIYDAGAYFEKVVTGEGVAHLDEDEVGFVRSVFDTLSSEAQERWRDSATKLGAFALKRVEAETVEDYIEIVADESVLMAAALLVENDDGRADWSEREAFNEWLYTLSRGIYAFDTFTDIIQDRNEENTRLQVTPRVIVKLGHNALREVARLIRATPPAVYPAVIQGVAAKVAEKAPKTETWTKQLALKKPS